MRTDPGVFRFGPFELNTEQRRLLMFQRFSCPSFSS